MTERRTKVPFNPFYFQQQALKRMTFSLVETFDYIYESKHWNAAASISGAGAGATQTEQLRIRLPELFRSLAIETLLDLPCGDFSWLSSVELPVLKYIGADIVSRLVERNNTLYAYSQRSFIIADITCDKLPDADLILCRDCLVHLSFRDIKLAINNIRHSSAKYLLTTTFTDCNENEDIVSGDWRVLNLEKPPFNFPPPLLSINERCSEGEGEFADKSLGLWLINKIPL